MELMTGFGLASAAGLNAYIPLLSMGLLDRYTSLVNLPGGWAWLSNGWVIAIVAVLLLIEIVADKVPALDSVTDIDSDFRDLQAVGFRPDDGFLPSGQVAVGGDFL